MLSLSILETLEAKTLARRRHSHTPGEHALGLLVRRMDVKAGGGLGKVLFFRMRTCLATP